MLKVSPWQEFSELLRVFRIFKLGKYSEGMAVFLHVLYVSLPSLLQLVFFMILWAIICASLVFFLEKGTSETWMTEDGEQGGFLRPDNLRMSSSQVSVKTILIAKMLV
eukprot:TRINITY_DN15796_c0_g1_i1.p1 TRINITY_DN15796_c0_g1~~TRINITY_DN15796_c0_g1_i1.p1  ORF type:complete len:108 (-),score=11.74 TRINITY_DN15796_c0_g1_i1:28-351(-)